MELIIEAATEKLSEVLAFLDEFLEANEVPMKAAMQLDLAVEELFVNIASYAYAPDSGMATVSVCIEDEPRCVTVKFTDTGKAYNPLDREDPDTTLTAEERGIGGLGIFMVKKSMDEMTYEYANGANILTIKKYL